MTEQEWLTCSDPDAMLAFLQGTGLSSPRKLRLYACACGRRLWNLLNPACREALDVAAKVADDTALQDRLSYARNIIQKELADGPLEHFVEAAEDFACTFYYHAARGREEAVRAVGAAVADDLLSVSPQDGAAYWARRALAQAAIAAALSGAWEEREPVSQAHQAGEAVERREQARQVRLLHDVFGNPLSAQPRYVATWRTPAVQGLAQRIYEDRSFERVPELAIALQEAGCADAEVLGHLRAEGPHARGCWVVDLLLGKA